MLVLIFVYQPSTATREDEQDEQEGGRSVKKMYLLFGMGQTFFKLNQDGQCLLITLLLCIRVHQARHRIRKQTKMS